MRISVLLRGCCQQAMNGEHSQGADVALGAVKGRLILFQSIDQLVRLGKPVTVTGPALTNPCLEQSVGTSFPF